MPLPPITVWIQKKVKREKKLTILFAPVSSHVAVAYVRIRSVISTVPHAFFVTSLRLPSTIELLKKRLHPEVTGTGYSTDPIEK